jgi:hypothetical protein
MVSPDGFNEVYPLPGQRLIRGSVVQKLPRVHTPAVAHDLDQLLGRAEPDLLTCLVIAYLAAPGVIFLAAQAAPRWLVPRSLPTSVR